MWIIKYYNREVQNKISEMPVSIRANYARLTELLTEFGADLRLPHSRAMGNGLFELRLKGKEGIGRVFYCTLKEKQIVILHSFIKKTTKTPKKELDIAIKRMKEVKNEQKC